MGTQTKIPKQSGKLRSVEEIFAQFSQEREAILKNLKRSSKEIAKSTTKKRKSAKKAGKK